MNINYYNTYELTHHGIQGQKWGVRHGPPYPLKGGSYTAEIKKKKYRKHFHNDANNKKHFDKIIKKDTELNTLSYDKNRTKNTDMFFAAFDKRDKDQYRSMFNKKIEQDVYDESGNKIGSGSFYKFQITNKIVKDVKVASEDSGSKAFKKLYSESRDFYNFVNDQSRMEGAFDKTRLKFKGYRESMKALENIRANGNNVKEEDLNKIYRLFNYIIPSDGKGNEKLRKDVERQRARFFKELKSEGYSAVLDTNDSIYGGFKGNAPVILFDMEAVTESYIRRLGVGDKAISTIRYDARKSLGL